MKCKILIGNRADA